MKRICLFIFVLIAGVSFVSAEPAAIRPEPGNVSVSLDDETLENFVHMMTKMSGVNISFDPRELYGKRVTIDVDNKPWKELLESVLAHNDLVLVEGKKGSEIYSIVSAAKLKKQELTGVLRKNDDSSGGGCLEIDGEGVTKRITIAGRVLSQFKDGDQVRVKGEITTRFFEGAGFFEGAHAKENTPKMPSLWLVVMEVDECKKISKPFEKAE